MDSRIIRYRNEILQTASKYQVKNVRIFGSQVRGEEKENSDLDLLVEFENPNLIQRISLKQELEDLLGMPVDVLTEATVHPMLKDRIMLEAVPL
ncbi:nucleotidyltransferase family protein [Fodinisporobacter ferrooxydans]|uniref:Nucleotidyltransferase family protein n=1 Tax=Fodinisporobacter ferrooxydans TaxID=2901836 RepID=A0ABY4CLX7_9BACL|nr:nucleotidyltransferase family protein [Alicyclobacillaceae bacterium MYW30-H2]